MLGGPARDSRGAGWVHCGQEGTDSSKLATSWYQQPPQALNPALHTSTQQQGQQHRYPTTAEGTEALH